MAAVEWSFDALDRLPDLPDWFAELLTAYAGAGRLLGHGIYYSVCNADWTAEQAAWLERLTRWQQTFPLAHVTEHFGFLTGRDFHRGAPVAPPLNAATLRIGQDRLQRLQQACGRPVGLENLALAYCPDDVYRQGAFLAELLRPVNGFCLLDAHNLYCQAHNFGVDPVVLCNSYPLDRVREIHISGGSWEAHAQAPGGRVRRDTHDERVPEPVWAMLAFLLRRCPSLGFVTLEQLGPALGTPEQRAGFRADFQRLEELLSSETPQAEVQRFKPPAPTPLGEPWRDAKLLREQRLLSSLLEQSPSASELHKRLATSDLRHSDWRVEDWAPHMLETARLVARKWA